eukprot:1724064-Amphidinium_carterae.1
MSYGHVEPPLRLAAEANNFTTIRMCARHSNALAQSVHFWYFLHTNQPTSSLKETTAGRKLEKETERRGSSQLIQFEGGNHSNLNSKDLYHSKQMSAILSQHAAAAVEVGRCDPQ